MPRRRNIVKAITRQLRFNTSALLGLMTVLSISMWANMDESLGVWAGTTLAVSLLGAFYGLLRSRSVASPVAWGGIFALANVIGLEIVRLGYFLNGYYSHTGTTPYFEDGFVMEVIVNPAMAMLMFGVFALAIGAILGGMLWCMLDSVLSFRKYFR